MRASGTFSTFVLVVAAGWLAAGILLPSSQPLEEDFDLYAWMAEEDQAAAEAQQVADAPVDEDDARGDLGSLDDKLWSILLPKQESIGFSGTGGAVPLRLVANEDGDITIPREQLDAAIEGALEGTEEGYAALLDYFDVVGGNDAAIAHRAQVLLGEIAGDSSVAGSLPALTEAATNISEAAFAALQSSYIMQVSQQPDFTLTPGSIGFDFGPVVDDAGTANPVFQNFKRVPADSGHVEGDSADVETSSTKLWGDGVRGMTVFSADVPNGIYKVYVMTSEEAGIAPDDAFGVGNFLRNDQPLRRIDLYERQGEAALALMDRQGITATMDATATLATDSAQGQGSVLMFRTEVRDGLLYIDFPPGAITTYIVGIVIVPTEDLLGAQLSEMVSELLETITPAAGTPGPGQATAFAAPASQPPGPGGGGGGFGSPSVPFTEPGPSGDGDGDPPPPGDGDGDGDGDPPPPPPSGDGDFSLQAEGLGPYTAVLGDEITLDGTQSLINDVIIGGDVPDDLLVEWLFDIDGDGTFETLVATDLVAVIDSDIFGATGEFQGILRLTLNGVVSEDAIVAIITSPGGGPIPEPGTMGLLAGGAALMAVLRRRRRQASSGQDQV